MKIFTFPLAGASPGLGGEIVVLALTTLQAKEFALKELQSINADRPPSRPVTMDMRRMRKADHPGVGVVHSYDGEA